LTYVAVAVAAIRSNQASAAKKPFASLLVAQCRGLA
jgi:hypothetical protein